jgi:chloride channel 3/4/5
MLPFALLGVLGGLIGALFIKVNLRFTKFRSESFLKNYPLIEVTLVALITAFIKYLSQFTRGNVTNVLEALFGDCAHAPSVDPLNMCDIDNLVPVNRNYIYCSTQFKYMY